MSELTFPLLTPAVLAPLAGVLLVRRWKARAYESAIGSVLVSLAASAAATRAMVLSPSERLFEPWSVPLVGESRPLLAVDPLTAVPMVLYTLLALAVLLLAPRRDRTPRLLIGVLWMLSSTLAAYTAEHLLVLLAACLATLVPLLEWRDGENGDRAGGPTAYFPIAGAVFLAVAVGVIGFAAWDMGVAAPLSLTDLRQAGSPGGRWAFAFLMLSIMLRKGIFPFHSWVAASFERGPLLLVAMVFQGHLGVFLLAKIGIPLLPSIAHDVFPFLSYFALFTAIYAAVTGLGETRPRRLLALISVSEASFILAGIESMTLEGIGGALVQWLVVSISSMALIGVLRLVEVRLGGNVPGDRYLGLAARAPRLAVFFVVSGLAIIGLPGTLGFPAEDLLLHGSLESHPVIGLALPFATAINAFLLFRLFARLFLGRAEVPDTLTDALPRERWVLTAAVVLLCGFGIIPKPVLSISEPAATHVVAEVGGHIPSAPEHKGSAAPSGLLLLPVSPTRPLEGASAAHSAIK